MQMKKFFVYFLPWIRRRIAVSIQKTVSKMWESYVGVYSISIGLGLVVSFVIGLIAVTVDLLGMITYRNLNNIPDPSLQMSQLVTFNVTVLSIVWGIHVLAMIVLGQWKAFNDEQAGIVQQLSNEHVDY